MFIIYNKRLKSIILTILYVILHTIRWYVRVVKETDLKSVGHSPRRFEPCYHRFFYDTVPEWLRGWIANPLSIARASSNLASVAYFHLVTINYMKIFIILNLFIFVIHFCYKSLIYVLKHIFLITLSSMVSHFFPNDRVVCIKKCCLFSSSM